MIVQKLLQTPGTLPPKKRLELCAILEEYLTTKSKLTQLKRSLETGASEEASKPVEACLALVGTEVGDIQLQKTLQNIPFPHYEPSSSQLGFYIRTDAQGHQTLGQFVGRDFIAQVGT